MSAYGPAFSEGASRRRFAESKREETIRTIEKDEAAYAVFSTYAITAMADPKAPLEVKAMGAVPWSYQVLMLATFLYWVDPMGLRKDAGLDESYHMFRPVRERVDRVKETAIELWNTPPPSIWDLW